MKRLITLDLDDTLWPCMPVIHAAEAVLWDWLEDNTPAITRVHDATDLRRQRLAIARERPDLAHDVTALRLAQLEDLMRRHGYPVALASEAAAHFRRARNRVTPFADVPPALARLRGHARLVALTNGNAQLDQTPLAGLFDHSLTAGQVGAAKPDPALFLAACDWADVAPQDTLHVGDDPVRDVAAAAALGMVTVWINRDNAAWPAELPPPDWVFKDLTSFVEHYLTMVDQGARR